MPFATNQKLVSVIILNNRNQIETQKIQKSLKTKKPQIRNPKIIQKAGEQRKWTNSKKKIEVTKIVKFVSWKV